MLSTHGTSASAWAKRVAATLQWSFTWPAKVPSLPIRSTWTRLLSPIWLICGMAPLLAALTHATAAQTRALANLQLAAILSNALVSFAPGVLSTKPHVGACSGCCLLRRCWLKNFSALDGRYFFFIA